MSQRSSVVAITAVFYMAAASRASGAASYADRIHQFSEDHSRVTVYNRRTGRVVWHRSVAYIHWAVWSRDRRAFALVDDAPPSADTAFRLTVWRAGRRARSFLTTRPLPSLDAIGYLAWSPDDKRLLMLGATGQGGASVGYWDLWCLNVDRGRTVKLSRSRHGRSPRYPDHRV